MGQSLDSSYSDPKVRRDLKVNPGKRNEIQVPCSTGTPNRKAVVSGCTAPAPPGLGIVLASHKPDVPYLYRGKMNLVSMPIHVVVSR